MEKTAIRLGFAAMVLGAWEPGGRLGNQGSDLKHVAAKVLAIQE